jgi:hypothetical protein
MDNAPLSAFDTILRQSAKRTRTVSLERLAILYGRTALGAAFLSAVADRFGLWGKYGGWGNFANFTHYTAQVNSFMPAFIIPFLAWAATAAELLLGIGLILGLWPPGWPSAPQHYFSCSARLWPFPSGSSPRWTIQFFPHPQEPYCWRCTRAASPQQIHERLLLAFAAVLHGS